MDKLNESVLSYAREKFRDEVADLLDDPSDLLHPWREQEPAEYLNSRRLFARDLGLDFDALVAAGSPYERERLYDIEFGVIKPQPRKPFPGDDATKCV